MIEAALNLVSSDGAEDLSGIVSGGLLIADNGEPELGIGMCQVFGSSRATKVDGVLVSDQPLGGDVDLSSALTVIDNNTITVDTGLAVDLTFRKKDQFNDNDVCMVFPSLPKLPRSSVTCIDEPLLKLSLNPDAGSELIMGVVVGSEIYHIGMSLQVNVQVGTYELTENTVKVFIASSAADFVSAYGIEPLEINEGTVIITKKTSTKVKGSMDLITDSGENILIDFNSRIY